MLRKLRIQFIAITMSMIAVVLIVIFVAIGFSEYQRSLSSVQSSLETAIERSASRAANNSSFFHGMLGFDRGSDLLGLDEGSSSDTGTDSSDNASSGSSSGSRDYTAPQIGGNDQNLTGFTPVAVYCIQSGSLVIVPETTTAFLTDEVLAAASENVDELSFGAGEITSVGLHYVKENVNGTTYIAFADSSSTDSWKNSAVGLAIAGVVMLLVFFVLILFLSKWVLRPVKNAWDSQKQFVMDASHELKTPLTVVLANSSILLKHPGESIASQSQWIESTQQEAESMQSLVNEMLELAQVETRAAIAMEPHDISEALEGICLQFESVAFERGFNLETDIDEGVSIRGDAAKLDKMASTLIENAAKYVNPGGKVSVDLHASGSAAKLVVTNTGQVIAAEDLPHIFDRFYRTDKARTSGAGGFGLGLAIARETARAHHGDITATSNEETGTTFTVTLPLSS